MKNLSVAIFGNTNNYPLLLAQGLRALGHRVTLIVNRKDRLHRPESRYLDWTNNYPEWILDYSYLTDDDFAYLTPNINETLQQLCKGHDLVILNDTGPSIATFLRCRYITLLTGSDLTYLANFEMHKPRTMSWSAGYKRSISGRRNVLAYYDLVSRQRDGICGANLVCFAQRGLLPDGDRLLDDIGVSDEKRIMLYFSNTLDLTFAAPPQNDILTLLSAARVVFDRSINPFLSNCDFKGTDILIKGYSKFIKAGGEALLRLPNKGVDVVRARALTAELGISNFVEWYEERPIFELYNEMRSADLVVDQLGQSFPAMVTGDAYALGRPVMANFRNDIFLRRFGRDLPGFNVVTEDDVASTLFKIASAPECLEMMGVEGREFAESHTSPLKQAAQLLERLKIHVAL